MKKLLLFVLLFISVVANAQKGISYQAVILDPSKIEIPGQDISSQPFVNGNVSVKFVILSGTTSQFEEVQQTKTDAYGLVNLTIGSVASTAFNALTWDANQKSLQVFVSFNNGASYTKVSDQKLTYSPYALFSETAGKLGSTLEIANGGTGATTAVGARVNLGLGNVDNTADASKPISVATQAALNLKANASDLNAGLNLKAPLASPTFTGTVSGISKSMVGLDAVDNTSDVAKPISTATQAALDLKSNATDVNTALDLKAPLASPTFTGTVSGISKSMVGLDDVDNTSDVAKPISTATQAALDLKAPLASPTFSGIITAAGYKIPNGTSSQYLMANGSVSSASATNLSSGTTGILPIASGGTGSSTKNFVDLTSSQSIAGGKTFTDNLTVKGMLLGSPASGSQNTMLGTATFIYGSPGNNNTALGFFTLSTLNGGSDNTAVGTNALRQTGTGGQGAGNRNTSVGSDALSNGLAASDNVGIGVSALRNTTGGNNVALGNYALYANTTGAYSAGIGKDALYSNTTGSYNTASGAAALYRNTTGDNNTASGYYTLGSNTIGANNTALGYSSLYTNTTGANNTAVGRNALFGNLTGSNNTAIGDRADVASNNLTNATAIGNGASVTTSNTIQLGNTSVTNVKTSGTITAGTVTYPNTHGTSNQVLSTTGSGTLTWTTPISVSVGTISSTSNANGATITAGGVLNLAPADASNGGIVTTGSQTFSGNKDIKGNLSISRLISNEALDQSYTTGYAGTGAYSSVWQSFTAGASGVLSKVSMQFYNSQASGTLFIYQGTGTTGTLLTSQPFSISCLGVDLMIDFPLTIPVDVLNNSVYTMAFIANTGSLWEAIGAPNSYARGASYFGNTPSSSSNFSGPILFKTFVGQSNGGGILTAGAVTYPSVHGSNGQVLSTTGSGTLTWTTAASGLPSSGNTAGDMLYWNGSAWVKVAAGANGQTLAFASNTPFWTGTISYKNTVKSLTGRIWMDRNVGASSVATSATDANAYGDLFQWGRGADGHESRTAGETNIVSTSDTPGHGDFINQSSNRWRSPSNLNLWQGVTGKNNVCPVGFRIPTKDEWAAELATWGGGSGFASVLKLPLGGHQHPTLSTPWQVGGSGSYWSSTPNDDLHSWNLGLSSTTGNMGIAQQGHGFSIRCIKD